MKRFNRHGLIALIVSSLVLLAVFQVFWIKKVYDEQLLSLKKDLEQTFRTTVMGLQDSLIQENLGDFSKMPLENGPLSINNTIQPSAIKSIQVTKRHLDVLEEKKDTSRATTLRFVQQNGVKVTIKSDSLSEKEIAKIISRAYSNTKMPLDSGQQMTHRMVFEEHQPDSVRRKRPFRFLFSPDSSPTTIFLKNGDSVHVSKTSRIEKTSSDSTTSALKSGMHIVLKTKDNNAFAKKDSNIFIKLNLDSLRINDITTLFSTALLNQKIDLPFRVHRFHQSQLPPPQYAGLMTTPVFAGMPRHNVYVAQFPDYQSFIFRKTLPQVLFSFLLFGMTALAFGLVYRSLRQQERLTALKNDFISNITHELKTPIATVSVAIEAMQNFNALQKPELTKEYLDISKNELSRLSMLVDKVLKLSVFEEKQPKLKKEYLDMASLVAEVLDSMRLQFEKLGVKIDFNTDGTSRYFREGAENTFVEVDKTHLTSVIYNLLDNAIKYDSKNIHIQFSTDKDTLKMSVEDDGCGIPSEYQSKIFDKFFRVPKGNVHNVKGYGLGLSYVASILKQHGGRIEVQSVSGKGSVFSVFLPKK